MIHFRTTLRVILGFLGIFVLFSGTSSASTTRQTIHVGIYAPFTNDAAYIGRNMLGAMEIAREQLKSSNINYEFYTLDVIPNQEKATVTLQKFIQAHQINVLVTEGSNSGAVVRPLARKNNLIHFCLSTQDALADGTNNFLAKSSNYQRGTLLTTATKSEFVAHFEREYFSQPVTEAGYAYDIFHLLNNSAVLAMKNGSDFSSKAIASNLLALDSGTGLMGAFQFDKKGVFYKTIQTV